VPNTYVGLRISDTFTNWTGMSSTGVGAFNNTCFGILFSDAVQFYQVVNASAGTNNVTIRLGTTNGVTPVLQFNGQQILMTRQTGPGNPSGWADGGAQAWAQNLLNALRNHGLVT